MERQDRRIDFKDLVALIGVGICLTGIGSRTISNFISSEEYVSALRKTGFDYMLYGSALTLPSLFQTKKYIKPQI